jgi:hypothetical protein
MSLLDPNRPHPFIEPEEKFGLVHLAVGIILSAILLIGGICQTQLFVRFWAYPDNKTIRGHMAECRKLQDAMSHGNQEHRIVFQLFDDKVRKTLEATRDSLLNDDSLQSELKAKFGVSFRELDVVVIPAWENTPDNIDLVGVTQDGWKEATKVKGYSDVGGVTVRDKPILSKRTVDGRPRIVLNPCAFQNLRLTLFHELIHAMNVPAYYPSPLTFAQNDLIYLPEYREIVRREHLDEWREIKIWTFAVIVPALLFGLIIRRFVKLRARLRRHAHAGVLSPADAGPLSD